MWPVGTGSTKQGNCHYTTLQVISSVPVAQHKGSVVRIRQRDNCIYINIVSEKTGRIYPDIPDHVYH